MNILDVIEDANVEARAGKPVSRRKAVADEFGEAVAAELGAYLDDNLWEEAIQDQDD